VTVTNPAPLAGLRVVVTRARPQAAELAKRLAHLGAVVVEVPVIEIAEPLDGGAALASAVDAAAAGHYDWVVVTSTNGAQRVAGALADRLLVRSRVAAIGPATADVLARAGIEVDLVPDRYVAEALVEAFPAPANAGRVLVARAAAARDVLPEGLEAMGWEVDVVEAYRTARTEVDPSLRAAAQRADVVTFTSPSTVEATVAALGADRLPAVVACIGPVTAATAREHGLEVTVEAAVHTMPGLVDALAGWARDNRK
jgi:uroporphyrinogen-III synthase